MKKVILLTLFALTANSSTLAVRAVETANQVAAVSATDTNLASGGQPRNEENLGYVVVDGKTNKIGRIFSVTPSYVWVIYDPSTGGRKIPRQELPPELKARFPYDAAKAAEYQKQQMEAAARQAAVQAAVARETGLRREAEITNEIAALREQDVAIQKEVRILKSLPGGNGRKVKAAHLHDQQESIRERISGLRTQLEQLQAQRDRMP